MPELRSARKHEQRLERIRREGEDISVPCPEHGFHIGGRAIAEVDPYDFRGRTAEETPRQKVVVLRRDRELTGPRAGPNDLVVGAF